MGVGDWRWGGSEIRFRISWQKLPENKLGNVFTASRGFSGHICPTTGGEKGGNIVRINCLHWGAFTKVNW